MFFSVNKLELINTIDLSTILVLFTQYNRDLHIGHVYVLKDQFNLLQAIISGDLGVYYLLRVHISQALSTIEEDSYVCCLYLFCISII